MRQWEKRQQIIFDMARDQKIILDMHAAFDAELARVLGLVNKLLDPIGRAVDGARQDAGKFVGDLQRDAADCAGDDRLGLP